MVFSVTSVFAQENHMMEADDHVMNMDDQMDVQMLEHMGEMDFQEAAQHNMEAGHTQMIVDIGPSYKGQMAHVYVDLLSFLIALFLVMKIGSGKIRYPILVLGLTFLATGLMPIILGHTYMWLVALVKSLGGMLAIIWFLQIFGLLGSRKTEV